MRIDSPPESGLPGIRLRQMERNDLESWFSYLRLPQIYEATSWNLRSAGDLEPVFSHYESMHPASARRLVLIDEAAGQLIGTIGFHTVSLANRSAEIAYDLAPSHWGRGIATAVCESVTRWSYEACGFNRVQATTLIGNTRSEAVLVRAGFRREGLLRGYRVVRGTPRDFLMFARLAADQ